MEKRARKSAVAIEERFDGAALGKERVSRPSGVGRGGGKDRGRRGAVVKDVGGGGFLVVGIAAKVFLRDKANQRDPGMLT